MIIKIIVIAVLVLGGSLGFTFFIEWLQNREVKDGKNKGPSKTITPVSHGK